MPDQWDLFIKKESLQPYFIDLQMFLNEEYKDHIVYPEKEHIFHAFSLTPLSAIKVVIIGQDPYHGPGQAHGLAFSVKEGIAKPPSLKNIYKEIENDLGYRMPLSGDLSGWAEQGVFLLNTVLTVREGQAASHQNRGWEIFTDAAIEKINSLDHPVVFMLWGKQAQNKEKMITNTKHKLLKAPHPSPLSAYRGFFGCRHFSMANTFLRSQNRGEIEWSSKNI